MDTFQNYLAFPTINNILSTVNTTNTYSDLAREYGITGEDANVSSSVISKISSCLASYCLASSNCYGFGQTIDQGNGSDASCSDLQNSNQFPITLSALPYDYHLEMMYYDANVATIYVGDEGRQIYYRGELTDRHTYCNTSLTINGTSTPRVSLEFSMGTLACIQASVTAFNRLPLSIQR